MDRNTRIALAYITGDTPMPWTLDTRIELAPDRAGYVPTRKGILAVQPLIQSRDAILTGPQPRRLTEAEKEEILREEAEAARRCRVPCWRCDGRGRIPVGAAGNMELETTCPECGPDYR